MLGKTFKGMTDAMLKWQTEQLLARAIDRDEWVVRVGPELVVEVTFNDLQASPRYPAGLALRFARVKGYRPDKSPDDADTDRNCAGHLCESGSAARPCSGVTRLDAQVHACVIGIARLDQRTQWCVGRQCSVRRAGRRHVPRCDEGCEYSVRRVTCEQARLYRKRDVLRQTPAPLSASPLCR